MTSPLEVRAGDVLTPDEVAGLWKVPRKTVVELCRRGEIPGAKKIGRLWRIPGWGVQQMFVDPREGADAGLREEQGQVARPPVVRGQDQGLGRRGNEARGPGVRGGKAGGGRRIRSRGGSTSRADVLRLLSE
ncbi:MAG: helix-turn-helix domain-containing protein [Myxococcales bacterium]|nr:helix-turn-helix domain-containing protein [Myxococcales bacterium]